MIGLRYTRAKRRNYFISFISMTSMIGIVLGVWALITVMSVMNGFHQDLRDRILLVVSHVTVSSYDGLLQNWSQLEQQIDTHFTTAAKAPFILGQGMLTKGTNVTGAIIRGIDPTQEKNVSAVLNHLSEGHEQALQKGKFGIILGVHLARSLGVGVGDKVTVVAPEGNITPAGLLPRLKRFTVVGLFELDMYEYDSGIALIHIDDAAKLMKIKNGSVSGLRIKLDNVDDARRTRFDIDNFFDNSYYVRDWTQEHSNLFRALEIEKRVVFIVLLLIIAVAAFNIVSTLVMIVTDKQSDVAILRTLGLSRASVMKIFMVQGAFIGIIGTLVGGVLGIITALNIETIIPAIENFFNTKLFPSDIYIISEFPAQMHTQDVVVVILSALVMSFIATIYPAWRASRIQPAEALRYD